MQSTTPFRSYHMYTSCLREAFQFQINCYPALHRTITEHSNCTRWFVGYLCTPDCHPLVNSGMLSIKADRAKCQNSSCKVVGRNDDELKAYICIDCYIEEDEMDDWNLKIELKRVTQHRSQIFPIFTYLEGGGLSKIQIDFLGNERIVWHWMMRSPWILASILSQE